MPVAITAVAKAPHEVPKHLVPIHGATTEATVPSARRESPTGGAAALPLPPPPANRAVPGAPRTPV